MPEFENQVDSQKHFPKGSIDSSLSQLHLKVYVKKLQKSTFWYTISIEDNNKHSKKKVLRVRKASAKVLQEVVADFQSCCC